MRLALAIAAIVLTAGAAVAVDVSGVWRVRLHAEGFPDDFCTWAVEQRATDVVGYQTGCLLPQNAGPITGTVDAETGAFHLFFDVSGDPACPTYTFDGTLPPGASAFSGTFDCPASALIGTIVSLSRCGDGVIEAMEECDPGTADLPTDCCTADCHREPSGTACDSDGTSCTTDACDATGSCVTIAVLPDTSACADDPCMIGQECGGGACAGGAPAASGTACDVDRDACTRDVCDGVGTCVAGGCSPCCDPGMGCFPAGASACKRASASGAKLLVKDATPDGRDKVSFAWKGEATTLVEFGDPPGSTSYDLCVYHVTPPPLAPRPVLVMDARAPAGGTCGGLPCWHGTAPGYAYKDADATPDGLRSLVLAAGPTGHAKVAVKGGGETLPDSNARRSGVLGLPVTARVVAGSTCWAATFSSTTRNAGGVFKAKNR